MRKITYIVIHCTATATTATIQALRNGWKALGWKNPGYHYVIDYQGVVTNIHPERSIANGVAGHNANSIHISYIGGVEDGKAKDTRSDEQKASMVTLLKVLKQKYPAAKIVGHRDFSPDKNHNGIIEGWEYIKMCPSFDVATWLQTINLT